MTQQPLLLAIDQGTTSTRAIVFNKKAQIVGLAQQEFTQFFPADGWVEHDANEIWQTTLKVCREAISAVEPAQGQIVGIGITNQRETTVLWDAHTGEPVSRAIVWQDRRTADICQTLKDQGHETTVTEKTGLLLDPYFSATKIAWLLDHNNAARDKAQRGELKFGTTDSWLIYKLSGHKAHVTDATNASRTMLFDIHQQSWDSTLAELFQVPLSLMPEVKDCAADFATTDAAHFGREIPISGVAGDQQAALMGQACLSPGMVKSTYGTGCFMLLNTGTVAVQSQSRLLTTVACRLQGETTYALEGAIFNAGTAVQWLRDGLGIIGAADETEALAGSRDDNGGVYLVPAFTGLGAPWWDAHARGVLVGITRDTDRTALVRAALESVVYQTRDLIGAMQSDSETCISTLRVDGGMVKNNWLMQYMADILDCPIDRPTISETTALGAAFLAGLQQGVFQSTSDIADTWALDARFNSNMDAQTRAHRLSGWDTAVKRTLTP